MASTTTAKRAPKTIEQTVTGVKQQLASLERKASEEDPWVMAAMMEMAQQLEEASVRVMARYRMQGLTWNDIAVSINGHMSETNPEYVPVSGQTLIKRYAARVKAATAAMQA